MTDVLSPPSQPATDRRSRDLLQEIADALGVEVEAFQPRPVGHLFHTEADGTTWVIVPGANSLPVVRRRSASANASDAADLSVAAFLADHRQTPEGEALGALVDRVLLTYLR